MSFRTAPYFSWPVGVEAARDGWWPLLWRAYYPDIRTAAGDPVIWGAAVTVGLPCAALLITGLAQLVVRHPKRTTAFLAGLSGLFLPGILAVPAQWRGLGLTSAPMSLTVRTGATVLAAAATVTATVHVWRPAVRPVLRAPGRAEVFTASALLLWALLRPLPGLGPVTGTLASATALIVPVALLLAPTHPLRGDAASGWLLTPALAVVCDAYALFFVLATRTLEGAGEQAGGSWSVGQAAVGTGAGLTVLVLSARAVRAAPG